jgi:hypothetical protein
MQPDIRYARSGDVDIAYQVVGAGPRDLVMVWGWVSNIEVMWEEPSIARFLTRLSSFARVIRLTKLTPAAYLLCAINGVFCQ